ncbi:hypothetical protein LJC16_02195 [Bacteroidales bacterium OttesenSCG-928-C19]|nr:hypothetical protein [Bacteroidales bacterium OttesenSCG-928-C19]
MKNFTSLKVISILFKAISIAIWATSIILFIVLLDDMATMIMLVSVLLGGIVIGLFTFAFSELIDLFIQIEVNTRKNKANEIKNEIENFEIKEWKKQNPTKSLNDFYREKGIK